MIKARVIDIVTGVQESEHDVNFSTERGKTFLDKLIFACIHANKGVTIELDHTKPER